MNSVGKNLKFNQVRGRFMLLPSLFFSHYTLLTVEITEKFKDTGSDEVSTVLSLYFCLLVVADII